MNYFKISLKSCLKFFFKEIIANLLYVPTLLFLKYFFLKKTSLIVLNYHNFSKYNNYKIIRGNILETAYSDNFEKQILFLKRYFKFCYPKDFFSGNCAKGMNVTITFDDGYKDNYYLARPILSKHKVKSIFFVVTSFIGTKKWLWHDKLRYLISSGRIEESLGEKYLKKMNLGNPISKSFIDLVNRLFKDQNLSRIMMNWDEIKELHNSGFVIGSHTDSHEIMSFLTVKDQKGEIEKSLLTLSEHLGVKINLFAFPNGLFNNDTIQLLKEFKIKYGFSTYRGNNGRFQDKLKIKRIGINASDSIPVLLLKIVLNIRL